MFMKNYNNKKELKEITSRWNKTGLLDEIKKKDMSKMAVILEMIACELVKTCPPPNTSEKSKHEQFCGTILPIARRIYDQLKEKNFPNIDWLIRDCDKFYKEKGHLISELNTLAMDGEAEFCSMYCNDVVKRIKINKL